MWADPKGEFVSGLEASPVYKLFGKVGTGTAKHPPVDHPIGDYVGYHMRRGDHDANRFDWEQYIRFAKRHFKLN